MNLHGELQSEVLEKLYAFCAYQERCKQDIGNKLKKLDIPEEYWSFYITQLENERFLDEGRFVRFYIAAKIRGNKWGRIKIHYMLKQKQVEPSLIERGLLEINQEQYYSNALQLGQKKWRSLQKDDDWKKKQKTYQFLAQRGYESSLIQNVIEDLMA